MKHFSSEQTTTVSRAAIWDVWRDVSSWHQWDTELERADLQMPFTLGARGTLIPKGAPKSSFTITECTDGVSFTYTVPLPMARLEVAHYFRDGAATTFVHEVTFKGLLGGIFGRQLGGRFAAALPGVLKRIAALAEGKLTH